MAISYVASSTAAGVAANPPTVNLTLPTLAALDIIVIDIMSKVLGGGADEINTPSGYTLKGTIHEVDGAAAADDMRQGCYWKRAVAADSGATVTISRAGSSALLLVAVASAWRGCLTEGDPFDSVGVVHATNSAAGDIIAFPAINPAAASSRVICSGWKADDATTALANFTNTLTFTIRNDQENTTGTDYTYGLWDTDATTESLAAFNATATGTDGSCIGNAFALLPSTTTTVTKTIGSSGTYSTPQLWEDSMGTDHTTAERSAAGTFLVATFALGETLTWTTGGATAKLLDTDSTGVGTGTYITYAIIAGNPGTGVVTGSTSLATCVSTYATPLNVGVAYTGQCQNQEFTGANPLLTFAGVTTSTATPITLTTASGASFADNAGELTNALRYNASNGAGIRGTSVNLRTVELTTDNVTVSKLQIANEATQASATQAIGIQTSGANARFIDGIFEGSGTAVSTGGGVLRTASTSVTNNCLIILRGATACDRIVSASTNTFRGCTIVASDDLATAPTSIFNTTGAAVIQNCGIFAGDSTKAIVAGGGSVTATTCYSDISGTSGVTQTTFSNAFENVNDATRDYRLKLASALIDTGTTDASNTPNDIVGTARPVGAAYDVGAWEFTPMGGVKRLLMMSIGF